MVIESEAESQFVRKLASGKFGNRTWIGLTDRASENVFRWVNGVQHFPRGKGIIRGYNRFGQFNPPSKSIYPSGICVYLPRRFSPQFLRPGLTNWGYGACSRTRQAVCERGKSAMFNIWAKLFPALPFLPRWGVIFSGSTGWSCNLKC